MKKQPIGIFDSGIGGLTVAKAIKTLLPNEDFIYFGDTAHLPYGDKSPQAIVAYSKKISEFLVQFNCKMIVIACNTASSYAFSVLKETLPKHIKVINVIDPVVDSLYENKIKSVGVLGTKAMVSSHIYSTKIKKNHPEIDVVELPTPLFASMIEEGFFRNDISHSIIDAYLSNNALVDKEALILGCTHYPLIHQEISEFFNHSKTIIDSPMLVAKFIKNHLEESQTKYKGGQHGKYLFFMSLYTESFEETAKLFFDDSIEFKQFDLWKEIP
ncbi:MAG: glutamate racemase [Flavobacteriales bacterium]